MSTTDDSKPAGKSARRKGKGERKKKADARQTPAPVELQTPEPVEPQSPDLSPQSQPEPEPAVVESPPADQTPRAAEPVEAVATSPEVATRPEEDVPTAAAAPSPAEPEPAAAAPSPTEPAAAAPPPAEPAPVSLQTIANAYRDYTRKSFEEFGSFVEQLSGARSLDKAMTVQTEFVKRAYETSVAESQKICDLHTRLAKQTLDPFKGLAGKAPPSQGKR
jgi:hypothetical protein